VHTVSFQELIEDGGADRDIGHKINRSICIGIDRIEAIICTSFGKCDIYLSVTLTSIPEMNLCSTSPGFGFLLLTPLVHFHIP
jgi:hypothetical protein